jgi:flagellar assembly protein FliH
MSLSSPRIFGSPPAPAGERERKASGPASGSWPLPPLSPANRARVIRSDDVGVRRPISLSIPGPVADPAERKPQPEEPPPPPPDFSALREEMRLQGFQQGRQQGYAEGHQQGYAEGLAAAQAASAQEVGRMARIAASVLQDHATFFRAAENQVLDLAVQLARKVIEREVENVPDLAVSVIRAALEEMDARTSVRVRVSPEDAELLRRKWDEVVPPIIGAQRAELVVDPRVQPGGAIIETTQGQVDAQLESKLAQLTGSLWSFAASREE